MTTATPTEVRAQRLAEFNALLVDRNLCELRKLGDWTRGEIEFTGIDAILDDAKFFFTDIRFTCILPGGNEGKFTARFNANSIVSHGVVVVLVVNGNRFAIVRQDRPTLGRWMSEVPRAFGAEMVTANQDGRLADLDTQDLKPLTVVFNELQPEIMDTASNIEVTFLGEVAENSGTHTVVPQYYLVTMDVDNDVLGTREDRKTTMTPEGLKLELVSFAQAQAKAIDNHSIVALYKFGHQIRRIILEASGIDIGPGSMK